MEKEPEPDGMLCHLFQGLFPLVTSELPWFKICQE